MSGHYEAVCRCPHCDVVHRDAWEWPDGDHECGSCGKVFVLASMVERFYETTVPNIKARAQRVLRRAAEVLGGETQATAWIDAPCSELRYCRGLHGVSAAAVAAGTPRALLDSSEGYEAVLRELDRRAIAAALGPQEGPCCSPKEGP